MPVLHMLRLSVVACCLIVCLNPSWAEFPPPTNSEPLPESTRMPAEQAAHQMKLPPGFQASVFAAEPDVQNPIAMSWDSRGRLWVAENYTYAERSQKFDLSLHDRIVVFDNTAGDHFKTRVVFADNLQMLTGIEVGHGGVWAICPPKLLFIPDRDGDLVPDSDAQIVLDGFEVATQNYHNFANGLRFGPDGWLYGRCGGSCPGRLGLPGTPDENRLALEGGIWRYHPRQKTVEVLNSGTTNPWGHDWNSDGEMFFVNTVNGHLWHFIPGSHLKRPFTLDPQRRTFELIDFHADHWHFDTTGSWTASRDGAANQYGGGHAHSGTMIYEEHTWPAEYRDRLFTLNFHGRRANQEILHRRGSGYVASHTDDFFLADDTWFRGMDLSAGPDGNVFVIDWSDTGECHEHTGVHRTSGRIFKIRYDGTSKLQPRLGEWTDKAIVEAILSGSKWHRRQARIALADRVDAGERTCVDELKRRFESATRSDQKRVLLLTLFACGQVDDETLRETLRSDDEFLRAWSIRLMVDSLAADDAMGPEWKSMAIRSKDSQRSEAILPTLVETAKADSSSLVRLALASSLIRLPVEDRPRLASELVKHGQDAGDHNLPLVIWYGLMPCASDATALAEVGAQCELPTTLRLISRCLAEECERQPAALNRLLEASRSRGVKHQVAVLRGMVEGFAGWPSAPKPTTWDAFAASAHRGTEGLLRELSSLFGDGRAMKDLIATAEGKGGVSPEIQLGALSRLIELNPPELRKLCESLLGDARVNVVAARGLSKFDDPAIATALIKRYGRFRAPYRPMIVSILSSRRSFAHALLDAVGKNRIPKQDLTAFDVRQILAFEDARLRAKVGQFWGEIRESSGEKLAQIERLKRELDAAVLGDADKSHGRALFKKNCQNCHRLYGEGGNVGPDLTGANRSNLDYLLGNIVDPSAVVDKDYRMTVLLLDDGRIISGLVLDRSEKTTKIQTATELLVVNNDSIEQEKLTEKSPMPEGMLDTISDSDIKDLFGYLTHPSQVELRE
ncbi:MAG: PVC-type heme-binding CxxCH protein [Planctomycetota bacterium]